MPAALILALDGRGSCSAETRAIGVSQSGSLEASSSEGRAMILVIDNYDSFTYNLAIT